MKARGEYRVGDLFPVDDQLPAEDQPSVALLRFIVAARALVAVSKINHLHLESPQPDHEVGGYLMLLSFGAASEALTAFRHANGLGCFTRLEGASEEAVQETKDRLQRLCRIERDSRDGSLCRQLRDFRNESAFHWDLKSVLGVLCEVQDNRVVGVREGDAGNYLESGVPIAVSTALFMPRQKAGSDERWEDLIGEIVALQGDIFKVADATYTLLLKDKGVLEAVGSDDEE